MTQERAEQRIPLTAIRIDLRERSITFAAHEQPVAKLILGRAGLVYEAFSPPVVDASAPAQLAPGPAPEAAAAPTPEKETPITVTGRLKTQPRAGRPDARGNPTAWARLAAHDEGKDGPHLYSATFHRHTAKIALGLPRDAQITVQGYAHPADDPSGKRLDTLSVVNIVSYPGKATKGRTE